MTEQETQLCEQRLRRLNILVMSLKAIINTTQMLCMNWKEDAMPFKEHVRVKAIGSGGGMLKK